MTLEIEEVAVSDLIQDPRNARKHSAKNIDAIMSSYQTFGQRKPIVITHDGVVVAGNGQLEAALKLGMTTIQVIRTPNDWSEEMVMAFAIADNQTGALAEWNGETLLANLLQVKELDLLPATGFNDLDLKVLNQIYGAIPLPDEPYVPKEKTAVEPHADTIIIPVSPAVRERWDAYWNSHTGDNDERLSVIMDEAGAA